MKTLEEIKEIVRNYNELIVLAETKIKIMEEIDKKLKNFMDEVERPEGAGEDFDYATPLINKVSLFLEQKFKLSTNRTHGSTSLTVGTEHPTVNYDAPTDNDPSYKSFAIKILEGMSIWRAYNFVLGTVWQSMKAIPNIGIELEASRAILTATTGSSEAMSHRMAELGREAQRTGIEINTLRQSFRTFHASTSLAGEDMKTTWRIFTNMNTVITGLHMTTDQANHTFLALAQIFNKGKVQSEELTKQLGNLLPGALAISASSFTSSLEPDKPV